MNSAHELISMIERRGGRLTVEGESLVIVPPSAGMPFMDSLKKHKPEIIAILQREPEDYANDLRDPFVRWVDSSCVTGERFAGNLRALLVDFCERLASRSITRCPAELFAGLAGELGCIVDQTPTGETLVLGLALKAGIEAFIQNEKAVA